MQCRIDCTVAAAAAAAATVVVFIVVVVVVIAIVVVGNVDADNASILNQQPTSIVRSKRSWFGHRLANDTLTTRPRQRAGADGGQTE